MIDVTLHVKLALEDCVTMLSFTCKKQADIKVIKAALELGGAHIKAVSYADHEDLAQVEADYGLINEQANKLFEAQSQEREQLTRKHAQESAKVHALMKANREQHRALWTNQ
jgi:hypothetical protein